MCAVQSDAFEKYLLLDEIYDPLKKCKAKLMAPYLLEITRGEPVLMYPLEFTEVSLNMYTSSLTYTHTYTPTLTASVNKK